MKQKTDKQEELQQGGKIRLRANKKLRKQELGWISKTPSQQTGY